MILAILTGINIGLALVSYWVGYNNWWAIAGAAFGLLCLVFM